MSRNKTIFVSVCCVLGVLSAVNYWLARSLQEESRRSLSPARAAAAVAKAVRPADSRQPVIVTYPLIADDPADYGIISVSENKMPHEQMEWDAFMQKAIVRSGILETVSGTRAVEEMNTSLDKFEDTMRRVDEEMALFEKQHQDSPDDAYARERVQTLRRLKALGKALKNKVTTLPVARDLPVPLHVREDDPADGQPAGDVPSPSAPLPVSP